MTVLTESRALHGERQGGPSVGLNIAQDSIPPSVKMRQALWGIQWRVELVLTHLLEGLVVLLVVGHDGGGEGGRFFVVVVGWRGRCGGRWTGVRANRGSQKNQTGPIFFNLRRVALSDRQPPSIGASTLISCFKLHV